MPGLLQHVRAAAAALRPGLCLGLRFLPARRALSHPCPPRLTAFRPARRSTTVFSHAQTVVLCGSCSTVLCQPTGGKARLTEGCSFRKKVE